jgi:hypothetical protein
MNSKHTPGPWKIKRCSCGSPSCHRYSTDNGFFYQGSGYSIEDARLIAAAPELLEALEKLMDLGTGYGEASDLIRIICKPAIAKARGE